MQVSEIFERLGCWILRIEGRLVVSVPGAVHGDELIARIRELDEAGQLFAEIGVEAEIEDRDGPTTCSSLEGVDDGNGDEKRNRGEAAGAET